MYKGRIMEDREARGPLDLGAEPWSWQIAEHRVAVHALCQCLNASCYVHVLANRLKKKKNILEKCPDLHLFQLTEASSTSSVEPCLGFAMNAGMFIGRDFAILGLTGVDLGILIPSSLSAKKKIIKFPDLPANFTAFTLSVALVYIGTRHRVDFVALEFEYQLVRVGALGGAALVGS